MQFFHLGFSCCMHLKSYFVEHHTSFLANVNYFFKFLLPPFRGTFFGSIIRRSQCAIRCPNWTFSRITYVHLWLQLWFHLIHRFLDVLLLHYVWIVKIFFKTHDQTGNGLKHYFLATDFTNKAVQHWRNYNFPCHVRNHTRLSENVKCLFQRTFAARHLWAREYQTALRLSRGICVPSYWFRDFGSLRISIQPKLKTSFILRQSFSR